jgi:hypothetical protein
MSYRVTTKKNLIIFHNPDEWSMLLDRLAEDFGTAIRMRHIMRRELGFTARDHQGLERNRTIVDFMDGHHVTAPTGYHYENQVHLDFYTESSQSWFILKYL